MTVRRFSLPVPTILALALATAGCNDVFGGDGDGGGGGGGATTTDATIANATAMIDEGRETFRFETFGDEAFWGGQLGLHSAIAGAANGGVGPGLAPAQALALGLKVDSDALGAALRNQITQGLVDLNDPA